MSVPTILTEGTLQGQPQGGSDPDQFGAGVGRAVQGLGGQLEQTAGVAHQIAQYRKNIDDTRWTSESLFQEKNYVDGWMADPVNNAKESFPQDLQNLYKQRSQEYQKSAPSVQARTAFNSEFQSFMGSRLESAFQTAAGVKINNAELAIEGSIDSSISGYRNARNVPNVDANQYMVDNVGKISTNIDSMFGKIAPLKAKRLQDKLTIDSTYAAMQYSPDLADKVLHMGTLEGRTYHVLMDDIDRMRNAKNSTDIAAFDQTRANHLTMVEDGKSQDKLPLALYQSVLSRDTAAAQKFKDDALIDVYNDTNQFKKQVASWNPQEQVRALNDLSDKVGKNPDTASHDQQVYALATQQVANNIRQIQSDPVEYMVQNNPVIQRIRSQVTALPDGADKQKAMSQMLDLAVRYQGPPEDPGKFMDATDPKQYLNVPRNSIHVLTNQESRDIADRINNGSPKDALTQLNQTLNQYPEKYRALAFNDLTKVPGDHGIRGEFWAAYMNKDAPWVDDYLGVIQGASEIRRASNDKMADFDKALDSNNTWKQFENPLAGDNFQRQGIVEDFRSGISLYAMSLAQRRGMAPDKAVKESVSQLLETEMGLSAVNGKPTMIPRDQGPNLPPRTDADIKDIGRRLKLVSDNFIDPQQVNRKDEYGRNLFPVLNQIGHPDVKDDALRDGIKRNGVWNTTPDGKAAVLYYDDGLGSPFELRDNNNRAFMVRYDELPHFAPVTGVPGALLGLSPHLTQGLEWDPLKTHVSSTFTPDINGKDYDPMYMRQGNYLYQTNLPTRPDWLRTMDDTKRRDVVPIDEESEKLKKVPPIKKKL